MKINIKVISGGNSRYIAFGMDNKWIYSDENISSVLGISLFEYKRRFKNICKFYNHFMFGINIIDSISNQEIIKRFEQEFASELMILKINNSY